MNPERQAAEESVIALLSDLVYIVQSRPGSRWPEMADQALGHHGPPFEAEHLSAWHHSVQSACFAAMEAIVVIDADEVERQFRRLRAMDHIEDHMPIGRLSAEDPIDLDPALTIDDITGETIIDLTILEKQQSQDSG